MAGATRTLVEKYIAFKDFHPHRAANGDAGVEFGYDDEVGCSVTAWLRVVGGDEEIFGMYVRSDRRLRRDEWDAWIALCNSWNASNLWPRAYLYATDPERDRTATVILDHFLCLHAGSQEELVFDFADHAITGAFEFWRQATAFTESGPATGADADSPGG